MKKNVKRTRKKLTNSKPEDENSVSGELKDGTEVISEQTRLDKQLEDYTCEFERRLDQLNFTPKEKDLVILYIMNLHPRWKRLVEPLELTFQNWKEAAHLARHHCAKASAMLGAKRQDSLDILRSPESMALLSAGYFVPESHPFVQRYPGAEAVKHLIQGYNDNDSSVSAPSSTTLSAPSSPTCSTSTPPHPPPCNENNNSNSNSNNDNDNDSSQQQDPPSQISSPSPSINASQVKPEPSITTTVTMETNTPNTTTATSITKSKSPVQPSPTLPPQKEPIAVVDENAAADTNTINNNTNEIATDKTLEKLSAEKSNDNKPLEKPTNNPLEKTPTPKPTKASPKAPNAKTIKTSSTGKSKTNKNSICYRIPKEHTGVNLGFLDVQVNDKSVKALLSKIHWYVSAISLECAKRLDLEMTKKKETIKTTVFSLEEPIGIVQLPINNHHIPLYVLPMIYNGKVDLVLGSDFFNLFNSTLNIKARAIHFLDKETPYSVSYL